MSFKKAPAFRKGNRGFKIVKTHGGENPPFFSLAFPPCSPQEVSNAPPLFLRVPFRFLFRTFRLRTVRGRGSCDPRGHESGFLLDLRASGRRLAEMVGERPFQMESAADRSGLPGHARAGVQRAAARLRLPLSRPRHHRVLRLRDGRSENRGRDPHRDEGPDPRKRRKNAGPPVQPPFPGPVGRVPSDPAQHSLQRLADRQNPELRRLLGWGRRPHAPVPVPVRVRDDGPQIRRLQSEGPPRRRGHTILHSP